MTARLIPSPEEEELRASVRAFLERKSPEAEVRRLMISADGFDRDVWDQMANQLGLQGLAVPERFGGSGFGFRELAIAVEETGRALYTGPFFSSAVLATSLLLESGDEDAMAEWLPQLAGGQAIGTVALAASVGLHRSPSEFSLTEQDGGVVLDGMIDYVSDAAAAEVILVAHCDDRGLSVVAVDGRDQSVRAVPLVNVDETRRFASLTFDGTRGEVVGTLGGGEAWFSRAMDRSISALAVECVGGAQKCLEMAVDYAKERFTFGRAIGSYQAIKHKCADMKIAVDAATAAAAWAVQESAEDGEALPSAAALAKAYCPEAYFRVAGDNIQIHGGLGFTWECPAHLYFKRAKASELFLGSGALYRKRLSQELRENFQAAS